MVMSVATSTVPPVVVALGKGAAPLEHRPREAENVARREDRRHRLARALPDVALGRQQPVAQDRPQDLLAHRRHPVVLGIVDQHMADQRRVVGDDQRTAYAASPKYRARCRKARPRVRADCGRRCGSFPASRAASCAVSAPAARRVLAVCPSMSPPSNSESSVPRMERPWRAPKRGAGRPPRPRVCKTVKSLEFKA